MPNNNNNVNDNNNNNDNHNDVNDDNYNNNNNNVNGYNNVNHYNHNFFLSLFLPSIRYVNNNYLISTMRDIQRFVITSTIFCNS